MIIGITGGIGSGKSTVVSFFKKWGAQVINVDKLGWSVLEEKQQEIKKAFGRQIFNGVKVNRRELGRIVFADPTKKRMLDSIIHPSLIKELKKQVASYKLLKPGRCDDVIASTLSQLRGESLSTLVVVDCALIYEWRIESWFDKIILVTSDYKNKLQRLISSGYTQKEAKDRIQVQLPDWEKTADWIIENNSDFKILEQNAKKIWNSIVNRKL